MRSARLTESTKALRTRSMSAFVIAGGTCESGAYGSAEGAIVS